MPASGHWQDLTAPALAALERARTVVLLPVAAVEQHGAHLPLATDALINAGIVERTLALLHEREACGKPAATLLVLPALNVGHSPEHAAVPGTLSADAGTLLALWGDVAGSVAAAGFRKVVLCNSHGGQTALVDLAAVDWRVRLGLLVARVHWTAFGAPPGLFDPAEWRHGLHGGEVETALMLHLAPQLVHMDAARDFRPSAPLGNARWLGWESPIGCGWRCTDLQPAGVCGNAAAADAARGAALLQHLARALLELIDEVAATAWPPDGAA